MRRLLSAFQRGVIPGLFVVALLLFIWAAGLFRDIQLTITNAYFVSTETSGNIVMVALDNASLNTYGRSPAEWSRSVYADLVTILSDAEARVIAFDLLFSEASTAEDDVILSDAFQAARNSDARTRIVLAGAGVQIPGRVPEADAYAYSQALYYEDALYPIFTEYADYVGYVNVFPDSDGAIRRQPSLVYQDETLYMSFNIAAYLAYQRIPQIALGQLLKLEDTQLALTP